MDRMMLALATGAVAVIGAIAVLLVATGEDRPASRAAVSAAGAEIGGPFELVTHEGERVTAERLIDGPTLLYFGYTWCPDVCPVDVAVMADAVDLLADRGIEVTPVFVTVDPERDDAEALGEFVGALHPEMIGLTGSAEEIAAAARAYKVYYAKAELEDSAAGYLMNHSTFIYLMTPDGLAALFRRGATAEEIAGEVARALDG